MTQEFIKQELSQAPPIDRIRADAISQIARHNFGATHQYPLASVNARCTTLLDTTLKQIKKKLRDWAVEYAAHPNDDELLALQKRRDKESLLRILMHTGIDSQTAEILLQHYIFNPNTSANR